MVDHGPFVRFDLYEGTKVEHGSYAIGCKSVPAALERVWNHLNGVFAARGL